VGYGDARIDQQPEFVRVVVPWESLVDVLVIVGREPQLLEVVLTGTLPSRLAGCLHRGQEQADERADDGDHDQKLDKRKTAPLTPTDAYAKKDVPHLKSSPSGVRQGGT
jgi:hypothetical protein